MFTVAGDTPITRFPVAVMTDYDGVIWTVADPKRDQAGTEFVPVDTQLPVLDDRVPVGATTVTDTITIKDLGGNFLPTAGIARRLDRRPPTARTSTEDEPRHRHDRPPRRGARRPDVRDPLGDPTRGHRGAAARRRDPERRLQQELTQLPQPILDLAPTSSRAARRVGPDGGDPRRFVDSGFYDATPDTPPGHSYGRIATMLTDPRGSSASRSSTRLRRR